MNRAQRRAADRSRRKENTSRAYIARLLSRVRSLSVLTPDNATNLVTQIRSNAKRLHSEGKLADRELRDLERFHMLRHRIEKTTEVSAQAAKLEPTAPEADRYA